MSTLQLVRAERLRDVRDALKACVDAINLLLVSPDAVIRDGGAPAADVARVSTSVPVYADLLAAHMFGEFTANEAADVLRPLIANPHKRLADNLRIALDRHPAFRREKRAGGVWYVRRDPVQP